MPELNGVSFGWSSAGLVTDVQDNLDNPAGNHGWIILGDEATDYTARQIMSREAPTVSERPVLKITFTPLPEPIPAAGVLGLSALALSLAGAGSWRAFGKRNG